MRECPRDRQRAMLVRERNAGHTLFDRLWRDHPNASWMRGVAYAWLASQLGISKEGCHFSKMNVTQCRHAIRVCRSTTPVKIRRWWHTEKLRRAELKRQGAEAVTP